MDAGTLRGCCAHARTFECDSAGQADLLQEILVAWWRSIRNFPVSGNSRQWLYRVSLNTALTWQRRESRHRRVIDRAAPFAQLIEKTAQPVDRRAARQKLMPRRENLRRALEELDQPS